MAAQLCDRNMEGEYVFGEHRIREYTARATVFELRRYMITLRARNAFLHGLDAFAEQHVQSSSRDATICGLIRECCSLRLVDKTRRDDKWDKENFVLEPVAFRPEDLTAVKAAATHWRGDCRDCGLSNALAESIAAAELRLVNEAINRAVDQFMDTRERYMRNEKERKQWAQNNCGNDRLTKQEYMEPMNAKLLNLYNKMHEHLCTVIRLGLVRIGMKHTSLGDFLLAAATLAPQGFKRASKAAAVTSASLAPRYLCLFAHIADQMRADRMRFVALQGLRLNLDLPGSKRVKLLAQTYAATGAIGV